MKKLASPLVPLIAVFSLIFLFQTDLHAHVVRVEPAPDSTVSGVVKTVDGSTLPGATILIKGTDMGTVTDLQGAFSFPVKQFPVTLVVSYIGYSEREITLNSGREQLDIVLREGVKLEEVTVTSRRREESLQDVPISVTAISGRRLEAMEAEDISRAANLAPNVHFSYDGTVSGSSSAAAVFIRGVGQNDFLQTLDPGVGVYVDGVYMGRSVGAVLDLVDVQQVEVLRGPQGTLFGRNTIGGAISLTSKDPTDRFEGHLKALAGSYNRMGLEGSVNIPFSNTMQGRITTKFHRRDGYVQRLLAGDDLGNDNSLGTRINLKYQPDDRLSFRLKFDYTRERETGAAEEQLNVNGVFADLYNSRVVQDAVCPTDENPNCIQNLVSNQPYTTNEIAPNFSDVDLWGAALISEYSFSDRIRLKGITAYRSLHSAFSRGSDGTPVELFQTQNYYTQRQFSQEVQLIGSNDRMDYVAGLYFFAEAGTDSNTVQAGALPFIPTFPLLAGGDVDNASVAGYAEATYHLSERLHFTAGVRYTTETKRYNPMVFAINHPTPYFVTPGFRELNFSRLTWRGILAYDISSYLNAYASVSTGFKSGGFDSRYTAPTTNNDPSTFDPETVINYEIGLKASIPEAGLRLNFSVFNANYQGIQVGGNPPGQIATVTFNGAAANIKGLEAEMDWSPTGNLIITGALGLLKGQYLKLDNAASQLTLDDKLIKTPTSSYNLEISYRLDLKSYGSLTPRLDMRSQHNIHFEAANNEYMFERGYHHFNFMATYHTPNKRFALTAGVLNLTNARYLLSGDSNDVVSYAVAVFSRPRNWMVSLQYNF